MPTFSKKIYMSDTDETGVVYFPNFFTIVTQAFEELLEEMTTEKLALPVVHASCDYRKPLRKGDHVHVVFQSLTVKESSIHVESNIEVENTLSASVSIVHAYLDPKTLKKERVPDHYREKLAALFEKRSSV